MDRVSSPEKTQEAQNAGEEDNKQHFSWKKKLRHFLAGLVLGSCNHGCATHSASFSCHRPCKMMNSTFSCHHSYIFLIISGVVSLFDTHLFI